MTRRPIPTTQKTKAVPQQPRLGVVLRFNREAAASGVRSLASSGFKVASSTDFRSAPAVPNDFGGADVQYFERFGIAIVRRDGDRLQSLLAATTEKSAVSSVRPERYYRVLGSGTPNSQIPIVKPQGPAHLDREYLIGYKDGVNHLVDRLLDGGDEKRLSIARFDETSVTWGLEAVSLPSELSGAGIKVAVLDTGFDHSHPDFFGRAITKKLFATNSSEDDVHGHGTHCIGTACGPLRPTHGVRYGIAYEAEIFAGKVLGDDGFGTDRSIIAGIDWAVEQGCQIISMSLGAATNVGDLPNDDYERIGRICLDSGSLIVAAAGNESDRPRFIAPVGSPANASTIMAVAAVDRQFEPARFSCGGINRGQDVDIAAPGVDVLSSLPGGKYARWSGTSMATPHVSGVAALLAQSDKKLRGGALWARLLQLTLGLNHPARDVGTGLLQASPPRGSGSA